MRLIPGPPRFVSEFGVWQVSRYSDVLAALRDPCLAAETPGGAVHRHFRETAFAAFSTTKLDEWRTEIEGMPFQSIEAWSLAVAVALARVPSGEASELAGLAHDVFASAAEPFDRLLRIRSEQSAFDMAPRFQSAIEMQAFIALSQTLPCFLTRARGALEEHPEEFRRLRTDRSLLPNAMEELLRYAGPSQAIFRTAREETNVGSVKIGSGARVMLALAAANRDPDQFADPNRLDFGRGAIRHLAFGAGIHVCAGAHVVRMAAAVAIGNILDEFYMESSA